MKQPNIKDYRLAGGGYSQKYITDLEKYCNELENKNKILNKALTYACKDIETLSGNCPLCDYDCNNYEYNHIECWKKYFIDKARKSK